MIDDAKEIELFIKKRFSKNCDWTTGNCLWFAFILKIRFTHLNVYYLPAEGHFVAGALGRFYDWTGEIVPDEIPVPLKEIEENDKTWYQRLMVNCLM